MDKKILNEIYKINSLMGNKTIINEIGGLAKIGVKEAILATKTAIKEATDLLKRDAITSEQFRATIQEHIDDYRPYLGDEVVNKFMKQCDDIAEQETRLQNLDKLANDLDVEISKLETELVNIQRNFNIEINKFKSEINSRTQKLLRQSLSPEGLVATIDSLVNSFDNIDSSTGKSKKQAIIDVNNTPEDLDDFIDNLIDGDGTTRDPGFINAEKQEIDSETGVSQSVKDAKKQKLEKIREQLKNEIKQKFKDSPEYQKKYQNKTDTQFQNEKNLSKIIDNLDPEDAQTYQNIRNKPIGDRTPRENEFLRAVDEFLEESSKTSPNPNKIQNAKNKVKEKRIKVTTQALEEPWFKNNKLLDFFTNWIEPMFRYRIDRLLKILTNRTSLTKKTYEELTKSIFSAFESARGRMPDFNAQHRRLLRNMLEFSQTKSAYEFTNFAELFDDMCKKIRTELDPSLLATFDEWVENVKTLSRDRRDIGFDELLTGKKLPPEKDFSFPNANVLWKNGGSAWLAQFYKANKDAIFSVVFHGKYSNPATWQRSMYESAIKTKNWKVKDPLNPTADIALYTRTEAFMSLCEHAFFKIFLIPCVYVLGEVLTDLWNSIGDKGYQALKPLDEYIRRLWELTLMFTPLDEIFTSAELPEDVLEWFYYFKDFTPTSVDDSIATFMLWYSSKPADQETAISQDAMQDVDKIWKKNKVDIKVYEKDKINDISQELELNNALTFKLNEENVPYFIDKKSQYIKSGKIDRNVAAYARDLPYRIITSPLEANPICLLWLYKEKVKNKDKGQLEKFKELVNDQTKLRQEIEKLQTADETNFFRIQPQIQIGGSWHTIALKNDKLWYYPISYEKMVKMIEESEFEQVDDALTEKDFNTIGTKTVTNENKIIDMIKKLILEQDDDKTLKMGKWNGIFSFQKVDEKNPGKFLDVKIKMDEVMDRMPHWREKYSKLCEELENCDDDGEDDSFVRAVIDTHPDVVRILFTKGLAHLTSSEEQEELNEGLHRLLSLIRESKNVEVEVWSVYRHPSSPDKIWSLVKGDYKPKELASMDVKMQQSPGNKVEKKKNSLDELKKKEYEAIKLLSTDEKKGITELPIKLRNKVKEKIKKGWTTEKPASNLLKYHKEEDLDSVLSDPIKFYKLKPNKGFLEYITSFKVSENVGRGFCRAIHYVKKEIDMDTSENKKINEILKTCENKFDGKYGQNYL